MAAGIGPEGTPQHQSGTGEVIGYSGWAPVGSVIHSERHPLQEPENSGDVQETSTASEQPRKRFKMTWGFFSSLGLTKRELEIFGDNIEKTISNNTSEIK